MIGMHYYFMIICIGFNYNKIIIYIKYTIYYIIYIYIVYDIGVVVCCVNLASKKGKRKNTIIKVFKRGRDKQYITCASQFSTLSVRGNIKVPFPG